MSDSEEATGSEKEIIPMPKYRVRFTDMPLNIVEEIVRSKSLFLTLKTFVSLWANQQGSLVGQVSRYGNSTTVERPRRDNLRRVRGLARNLWKALRSLNHLQHQVDSILWPARGLQQDIPCLQDPVSGKQSLDNLQNLPYQDHYY